MRCINITVCGKRNSGARFHPLHDKAALSNLLTQHMHILPEDKAKWCSSCTESDSDGPCKHEGDRIVMKWTETKYKITVAAWALLLKPDSHGDVSLALSFHLINLLTFSQCRVLCIHLLMVSASQLSEHLLSVRACLFLVFYLTSQVIFS